MKPQVRRRLVLLSVLVVALVALGILAFGDIGKNIVYYWSPQQLADAGDAARGATVRLGGLVKPGTVKWDAGTQIVSFVVQDEKAEVAVEAKGSPPEMFREGIGVLVEGTLRPDGVFQGDRLLVKHSNEYRAPVDGKHPGDIYKSTEGL